MMHQVTKRAIRWAPLLALAVAAGCVDPASIGDASLPAIAATDLPAAQEQVYHKDAVRLAFRELNRVGAPARSSIFVVAADGSVAYLGAFGPPVPEHWSNRP